MMIIFIVLGIIAMVFGILFLVNVKMLLKISDISNKVFLTDELVVRYRIGFGICLVLSGLFMFFIAHYLYRVG